MTARRSGARMLTLAEASREIGRSRRTLMRWKKEGMPTALDGHGRILVRMDVAGEWKRKKLQGWPPHQYRMRRIREEGLAE